MLQISENIKQIIVSKGLKQCYVAVASGFDPRQFNNLLNGRKVMRADFIIPIAKVLNTDPNTIYGYHLDGT